MDDILESQIKFKEQLLRTYQRLARLSRHNGHAYEAAIDEMLDELQKLYKQREQSK